MDDEMILGGGGLSAIQAIFAANGRSGRVVGNVAGCSNSEAACGDGSSVIQAILAANGRSGRVVEELAGRTVLIVILVNGGQTHRGKWRWDGQCESGNDADGGGSGDELAGRSRSPCSPRE